MGQLLATLPTCAHLSPDSQARLHRAGSVPCKPKTLKMRPTAIFSPTARPQGSCQHCGRCPHPRSPRGRGAGKTSCTLTTERCRLQPVKRPSCYAVASQALTGFQLRPLRLVLLPHGDGEGSRATKSCILPLTPWNRPNTHRRGRWIGFATCPCGLASESGVWGKAPRACFLFLKLLGWM